MGIAREFWMRCRAWLGRKKHEQDLDDDVQAHVELATEENMQRGMSSNEARRAALRAFGGVTQTKEAYRIQRGVPFVETLWRDVRYALRRLGKSPAFTAIVVVTLALGIGANTAIFTLVQGIMLRSLPVADPSQLVRIGDRTHCCYFDGFESDDGDFDLFSYDLYKRFRDAAPEFDELAAVQAGGSGFSVRWGAEPAKALRTEFVSGNYFGTLGVGAYAGRLLSPRDNLRGAAPVVVLSDAAWHTEFGGDTGVVGSTVYLQGHAFTVVGIAPPGFYGDRIQPFPPDMWMPLETEPLMEGDNSSLLQPTTAWLYAIGRLHEGANRKALQSKLSEVLRQWMKAQPSFMKNGNEAQIVRQHVVLSAAGGGIQKIQQQTGKGLWVLMLLSSVVLLIACANIANLLLARAMAQRGAIAIRVGLGATRGRVIRQMVTESLLLSLMGGVAGLAIAFFGARAILVLAFPVSQELPVSARPSWEVLLFALGVSVVTGLLFSCVPAWIASGAQPAEATRASRGATGDSSSLPQRALLVFQLALSIVLLSTAMLATRSLFNLEHQNTGFETEGRYTVDLDLKGSGFKPEGL
ncbi:MAG TPA: ABC transporter permease, partial [Terracidiphilus sp.]|nr:ABC transporter permease [Terracidiphilus sp.]